MRTGLAAMLSLIVGGGAEGRAEAQPDPAPAQAPRPPLTKAEAASGFYLNVARCLYSREHGVEIESLPNEVKMDLRPATAPERGPFKDPKIKVWTTDALGSLVLIAERSADRCDVVASQIPVEATFQMVMARLRQADPELTPYPVKPGYNPIAYQLERVLNGSRYIVHLEGAEPGGPGKPSLLNGHAFRFSLLQAWVVRQPESAKPPFR